MDSPHLFWLGLLSILAVVLGFWYYGQQGLRLQRVGGEVRPGPLGLPDLVVSFILGGFLSLLTLVAFRQSSQGEMKITREVILTNGGFQVALVGCLIIFLTGRKIRLRDVIHPGQISAVRTLWRALIMMICAWPIVFLVSAIAERLLPKDLRSEQEMVRFFGDASSAGNLEMMVLIGITAVIVAPLCEEFLFRGYFYPVWKRYFGATGSAILAATLFALMHANLASLPGLFAFALCLTIAFEATGSLIVPILMHALFNGFSLTMLYLRAQGMIAQ